MKYPPRIDPKKETVKITKFIKKTFKKAGKNEAVIAASGGIDSTTALLLTAKALSPKNVQVLHLPSKTTDPVHLEHAKLTTKTAKIPEKNITTIHIGGIIQKTWRAIRQHSREARATNSSRAHGPGKLPGKPIKNAKDSKRNPLSSNEFRLPEQYADKGTTNRRKINQELARLNRIRLANISARVRMIIIYDQAKHHDALVVGTENHSEHLLGYYTRFGDEASDLEPIKHLYKTQLIDLAKHLKVAKEIIEKPPTADLWRGQTDEGELGFSYEEADPILYLHFEQQLSPKDVVSKLVTDTRNNTKEIKALMKKVLDRAEINHFKSQLPYAV